MWLGHRAEQKEFREQRVRPEKQADSQYLPAGENHRSQLAKPYAGNPRPKLAKTVNPKPQDLN